MTVHRRLSALVVTAALLVVPSVGSPVAAAAAPASFSAYARFNVPAEDGTRDRTIEQELVALADGVPSGAYIRGVMYSWTSPPVAEALVRAAARGAVVRVVVDR